MVRFSTYIFCFFVLLGAVISSCQKDESVKTAKTSAQQQTDSTKTLNTAAPGNYLANKGTLTVKIQDSTYTFNAAQDSIAFVNIALDGVEYYGISAINKAHTVSFGISSSAVPIAEIASYVSGAQFLLRAPGKKNLEYTLTRNASPQNFGTIAIEQYNQDTILAKGTFHTYLARDTKANAPSYVVDGSFDLKVK